MGASGGPHERHAKTLIVFFSIFFGLGDFNMRFMLIKRIGVFFLILVLLFSLTFGFLNRPIKTHALPIAAIALGSGALGAIVAAYFATAGVSISGNSDTDGNFLGNYIANWVKNSTGFVNNSYFDNDGNFTGSTNDLSIVQNNDTDLVSFIFGKDFAAWLEVLKQQFVSDNSITSQNVTSLYNVSHIVLGSNTYPLFPSDQVFTSLPPSFHTFVSGSVENYSFYINSDRFLALQSGRSGTYGYRCSIGCNDNSNGQIVYRFNPTVNRNQLTRYSLVFAYDVTDGSLGCTLVYENVADESYDSTFFKVFDKDIPLYALESYDSETISLDGTLTDGYEDFEEAINQDLTNANEDEVAVVDVGTFPEVLDPTALIDDILDKIIDGTLNPEYDGTRENTESAEEEKEGSKPFTPTVPEGWVIVNGLEDFFPFCIPWDLYNLIAELNVPAKAPKFTYKVDLDAAIDGLEYDAVLDLAPFETVAQVFRIICVIGFVFFLILKTRDLIRG